MPISYDQWESYPWKNELALQLERAVIHFNEVLSDEFAGKHRPFHMMDRAIVLAGFSIRRMIEKRLLTDKLSEITLEVNCFPVNKSNDFRKPYHGHTGGHTFRNYDLENMERIDLKIEDLANEIIHASQIMVLYDEDSLSDGLLLVSDWHLRKRILYLTIDEFSSFGHLVLDDIISFKSEIWDDETGEVHSTRR